MSRSKQAGSAVQSQAKQDAPNNFHRSKAQMNIELRKARHKCMLRRKYALGLHEAMHHEALHTAHGYKAKGNRIIAAVVTHGSKSDWPTVRQCSGNVRRLVLVNSRALASTQTLQRNARLSLVACNQDHRNAPGCQAPRLNQPLLVELARSPSHCTTNAGSLDLQRFAYLSSEQPQSRDAHSN